MRTWKWKRLSVVLVGVSMLVSSTWPWPPATQAQTAKSGLTIVKISVPELDLYDESGRVTARKLQAGSLTLPLPVLGEEPSKGLLKIRLVDGSSVWVRKSQVITRSSEEAPPCDPGRKMVTGATRGSGERCR